MTRHERIFIWDLDARDYAALVSEVLDLEALARTADPASVKMGLHHLVPEYREAPGIPLTPTSDDKVVELPAVVVPSATADERDWDDMGRRALSVTGALALLAASAPLWALVLLESLFRREQGFLVSEVRVGRTRRRLDRRGVAARVRIDRRSRERRVLDLPGIPFTCMRFRTDLGPITRFLGRRGWDRVPFLLSVLRNDMSLVGPEPELADDVRHWQKSVPDYARRFHVSPGLISLSRIAGCHAADADGVMRRTHYDLHYVDHASLLLDLRTLARAAGGTFRRTGQNGAEERGLIAPTAVKGVSR
jgi:lipopolysaccharide/colanic/teichoic acid biosynthesis glycosyltransferase